MFYCFSLCFLFSLYIFFSLYTFYRQSSRIESTHSKHLDIITKSEKNKENTKYIYFSFALCIHSRTQSLISDFDGILSSICEPFAVSLILVVCLCFLNEGIHDIQKKKLEWIILLNYHIALSLVSLRFVVAFLSRSATSYLGDWKCETKLGVQSKLKSTFESCV